MPSYVEFTDEKTCKKQYYKQYYEAHKEEHKQRNKEYRKTHKEEIKQYMKQYREAHKKEMKQYAKQYHETHKEEISQYCQQHFRLKKYGITIEQEIEMLEDQSSKCAICGKFLTDLTNAYVDHDHKTGKVRGILCHHCNTMLGYAKDNPKTLIRAAIYLRNKGVYNGNQE